MLHGWSFVHLIAVIFVDRELESNQLNGTLVIGTSFTNQLQLVDLQNNKISEFNDAGYNFEIV